MYLCLLQCDRYHYNSDGKPGVFEHAQHEETYPGRLRQRPTTGNGNIDVLLANHAISGSRSLSQSFGYSSVELDIIENPEFGVRLSTLSVRVLRM